jgi:hypothetical protein
MSKQIRWNQFDHREFGADVRIEEGKMWLALASIVLASAIGFNVLALWLTDWFEGNQPATFSIDRDVASSPEPIGGHGYVPGGRELLSPM